MKQLTIFIAIFIIYITTANQQQFQIEAKSTSNTTNNEGNNNNKKNDDIEREDSSASSEELTNDELIEEPIYHQPIRVNLEDDEHDNKAQENSNLTDNSDDNKDENEQGRKSLLDRMSQRRRDRMEKHRRHREEKEKRRRERYERRQERLARRDTAKSKKYFELLSLHMERAESKAKRDSSKKLWSKVRKMVDRLTLMMEKREKKKNKNSDDETEGSKTVEEEVDEEINRFMTRLDQIEREEDE